jgi:ABC-type transporter Mla subunit MlaD
MTTGEREGGGDGATSSSLDDILARAVERQISEQRALREALEELRDAIGQPPGTPMTVAGAPVDIDSAVLERSLREAVETSAASLVDHVRDIRSMLAPHLDREAKTSKAVGGLTDELRATREAVGAVSADVEGIAQALIDLNAGLRHWATGVDRNVETIQETIEELRDLPRKRGRRRRSAGEDVEEGEEDEVPVAEAVAETVQEAEGPLAGRFDVMEERIKETAELSLYLSDQIEDLDRLMGKVGELPTKLEGVVAQALRRTLTTRSKLDKEAQTALDDVLGELDQHLDGLSSVLQRFGESDDHFRKIELNQIELTSRIESLQDAFIERLETNDLERRRSEEVLARAIDRSSRGLDPRAYESLGTAPRPKRAKPKPKAKGAAATVAKAKPAARKRKPKPKPSPATPTPPLDETTETT